MSLTITDVIRRWQQYNELRIDHPNYTRCGNLVFDRQVLKSYNRPIACYHPPRFASDKRGFVLLDAENVTTPWGTTNRHKWKASRTATYRHFMVPNIGVRAGLASPDELANAHAGNIAWMLGQIDWEAANTTRNFEIGSGPSPDHGQWGTLTAFKNLVSTQFVQIEDYMATTGAEANLPNKRDIIERVAKARQERWFAWSDPKAIVRRERARARREAIKALGVGD